MNLPSIIQLIRPDQWVKNLVVALPLFFSGQLLDGLSWCDAAVAFMAFSFIASSIYCLNDIIDLEDDRLHPRKRLRPLASGRVASGRPGARWSC